LALKEKQSGYLPIDAFASDDLGENASIPFVGTLTYRVVVNPIVILDALSIVFSKFGSAQIPTSQTKLRPIHFP
jgi:hypothetical protein